MHRHRHGPLHCLLYGTCMIIMIVMQLPLLSLMGMCTEGK